MKKFMMVAVMAMASLAASAQVYVGGGLGLNFTKAHTGADSETTFTISPEVGYEFNEKWSAGIQLGLTTSSENTAFSLAPYARYTFADLGNVAFFCDGGIDFIAYGSGNGTGFGIGVRPGVAFKASEKISFEAKLGYIGYNSNSEKAGGASNFGINAGTEALSIGMFFHF